MRSRTTLSWAAVGAFAVSTLMAAPAMAAPGNGNGVRVPLVVPGIFVVATCADGGTVSGPLEGTIVRHEKVDRDGYVVKEILNMEYKMTWTLSTTGESVSPHGTRHIVLDYVNGTFSDSGTYRTLTAPREGFVLKVAGRLVEDLETEELISKAGPSVAETDELVCALFGLEGV